MAYVDAGDEVVLFEPYYDSYQASVQMAGGVCRYVELKPPDAHHFTWWFDERELAAAFSERTRLVLVNTPHNPTGQVYTRDELTMIGELARRAGAIMLCDEVYEHLAFAPATHVRAATLPGFDDFTVTISSGGKSFSFTGWKVGWAIGRSALVAPIQKSHQWVTFATAAPFQAAIAKALSLPDSYFTAFAEDYQQRRDLLVDALRSAGFEPLSPEGTYFVIARTDGLRRPNETDVEFCKRLVTECGVVAIPPSVFYGPEHAPNAVNLARFAFCKTKPVLEEAARRLIAGSSSMNP
jgi:N-succinyldiaminopimelate aminotransferase